MDVPHISYGKHRLAGRMVSGYLIEGFPAVRSRAMLIKHLQIRYGLKHEEALNVAAEARYESQPEGSRRLTTRDLARLTGYSMRTIQRKAQAGEIPGAYRSFTRKLWKPKSA